MRLMIRRKIMMDFGGGGRGDGDDDHVEDDEDEDGDHDDEVGDIRFYGTYLQANFYPLAELWHAWVALHRYVKKT